MIIENESIDKLKVMSLQASEILKNNRDGKKLEKKYNAIFPSSLLLDKTIKEKLNINADNDKTSDIVIVKFEYGYTQFNEVTEKLKSDIENNKDTIEKLIVERKQITNTKDLIEEKKNNLTLRKLQKKTKDKKAYTDEINMLAGKIKNIKESNRNKREEIKAELKKLREENKVKKAELKNYTWDKLKVRQELYNNGFDIDFYKKDSDNNFKIDKTITYKFWFRTSSKSRIGEATYINCNLYDKIYKWQTMNIELDQENAKLVENEAYKSLSASNIIGKIKIPVNSILVLNDLDSITKELCSKVILKDDGSCDVVTDEMEVKNTLFDGMSILDDSFFQGNKSMRLLRQHYFKSCSFRGYVIKFFKEWFKNDYETATIRDKYGNDILVKDIRMLTTENSMKWEKLNKTFDEWKKAVIDDGELFGICKEEHPSKYGEFQRMSYQHVNSLSCNQETITNICKDSIKYLESLKKDLNVFLQYLERTACDINSNKMYIDLVRNNRRFARTETFCKFRSKQISDYKKELIAGRLLVTGDNLTVCGNPYSMFLHAVGQVPYIINEKGQCIIDEKYEDETLPVLEKGISVYTSKFSNIEKIACFRNPHNAPHNIVLATCYKSDLMEKYFKFTSNIMAVNCIKTSIQDRTNSCDFDSDFFFCSNNKYTVDCSIEAQKFPTIINDIPKENKTYRNTMTDLAIIDDGLAKGKHDIGLTSNLAQLALSWYYKAISDDDMERAEELLKVVVIASVLAQVAIDNSKRMYKVVVKDEIKRIVKLPCMQIKTQDGKVAKPYFWQHIKEFTVANMKTADFYDKALEELSIVSGIKQKDFRLIKGSRKQIFVKAGELKKAKLIQKTKEKAEKIKSLEKHCISEKCCPMDFLKEIFDTVGYIIGDKYISESKFIVNIDGKAEKQRNKIKGIVEKLDKFYITHKTQQKEGIEFDEEAWLIEQQLEVEDTINSIKKYKITPKTMQMLIKDAFSSNKYYKQRLLNCLYTADKSTFISCFVK